MYIYIYKKICVHIYTLTHMYIYLHTHSSFIKAFPTQKSKKAPATHQCNMNFVTHKTLHVFYRISSYLIAFHRILGGKNP